MLLRFFFFWHDPFLKATSTTLYVSNFLATSLAPYHFNIRWIIRSKQNDKYLKPWHVGTHLIALKSFPFNTIITGCLGQELPQHRKGYNSHSMSGVPICYYGFSFLAIEF